MKQGEYLLKYNVSAILCIMVIALTGCSSKAVKTQQGMPARSPLVQQFLMIENVESLQVVGGLLGTKGSLLFQKSDDEGKKIITKVVGWLNSAKPVDGQTEYGKHGYPMVINIKTSDNKTITVEPAYDCVSKTNADGSGSKTCTPAEGEIVIYNDINNTRAESSELFEWLKEGWKQEK